MKSSWSVQTAVAAVGGPIVLFYVINWLIRGRKRRNIKDKVVLITGANSGLGKACAYVFYKCGCHVILAGRNLEALEAVKRDLETVSVKAGNSASVLSMDLGEVEQIETRVREALAIHGRIDILVNNAGISYRGCIADTDLSVHIKLMTVNYFGQIALTRAVLPSMVQSGGGNVVAVSSVQGRLSVPYRSAYSASKHALQAYFDCLRAEMADQNISVCVVSPGYIQTSLSQNAVCSDGSSYGVMDPTTAQGFPPDKVANIILEAVETRRSEVTPALFLPRLAIMLRSLWPNLYFWVMAKRARKQRNQYVKTS